jgi:hypothetical protein
MLIIGKRRITNPKQVRGLDCWYDANVGVFTTAAGTTQTAVNGVIGRWEDQSGNGYHLTAPDANRPTLVNSVNSLRGVNFNGTNQYISAPNNSSARIDNGRMMYLFTVMKFNSYVATGLYYPISKSGGTASATSGSWWMRRWDNSATAGGVQGQLDMFWWTNGNWVLRSDAPYTNTNTTLFAYCFPQTQIRQTQAQWYTNGSLTKQLTISSNNAPSTQPQRLIFGAHHTTASYTPTHFANAMLNEVLIYIRTQAMTQTEIDAINRYLKTRWAL